MLSSASESKTFSKGPRNTNIVPIEVPVHVEKAEEVEAPELVTVYEMAFTEGDAVMAKWPGTNLFFHAKVTFVRDEDNEYDVQV